MIVRLLIMMGVYYAVVSPLTYVIQIDTAAINAAKQWTAYYKVAEQSTVDWDKLGLEKMMSDGSVIALAQKHNDTDNLELYAKLEIIHKVDKTDSIKKGSPEEIVKSEISKKKVHREVEVIEYLTAEESGSVKYPVVVDVYKLNNGELEGINKINFHLAGLDLTKTPNFSWNFAEFESIWIIPIISFVTSLLSSIVSMKIQKKSNPEAPSMLTMTLGMSVFSLVIAFGVPGAVGFYWACSNLISGGLQAVIQIVYGPNVIVAKEQSKTVVSRAKVEKQKIERINAATNSAEETEE